MGLLMTIDIPPDVIATLEAKARAEGKTMAQVLREAFTTEPFLREWPTSTPAELPPVEKGPDEPRP